MPTAIVKASGRPGSCERLTISDARLARDRLNRVVTYKSLILVRQPDERRKYSAIMRPRSRNRDVVRGRRRGAIRTCRVAPLLVGLRVLPVVGAEVVLLKRDRLT
jgi:hypothetical protein